MENSMQHIILATTGNETCKNAEAFALNYCTQHGAALSVIHVINCSLEHYGQVDQLATEIDKDTFVNYVVKLCREEAMIKLETFLTKVEHLQISNRLFLGSGNPLDCIVQTVESANPEFVVIGGRARSRLHVFSLFRKIRRKVACPVHQICC